LGVDEARRAVERLCSQINRMGESSRPTVEIPLEATGSATGLPFEKWFLTELSKNMEIKTMGKSAFLKGLVIESGEQFDVSNLQKETWWAKVQQLSPNVIKQLESGKEPKLQQALGDVIVICGASLNDIVLVNVKATELVESKPVGRPPNIVSALRLIEFLIDLFRDRPQLKEKVHVWIVCFEYTLVSGSKARVDGCHLRDMFKLDLSKAPPINFDAAIQIQWHVRDMVEATNMTLDEFSRQLVNKVTTDWRKFSKKRNRQWEGLGKELLSVLDNRSKVHEK